MIISEWIIFIRFLGYIICFTQYSEVQNTSSQTGPNERTGKNILSKHNKRLIFTTKFLSNKKCTFSPLRNLEVVEVSCFYDQNYIALCAEFVRHLFLLSSERFESTNSAAKLSKILLKLLNSVIIRFSYSRCKTNFL